MPEDRALVWKVNAIRTGILCFLLVITIFVADYLDKVFAIAGAVLGMTNVLLVPSLCHLKLIAETKAQRNVDYAIIAFACFMIVFGPVTVILTW